MNRETVIEMILDPARRPAPGTPEHQAFLAFLESSAECRQMYEQQDAVWSALDAWQPVEPSEDFDRAVYRMIRLQEKPDAMPWWSGLFDWMGDLRPSLVAGLAALMLIAGVIVTYQMKTPEVQPSTAGISAEPDGEYVDQVEEIDQTLDDIEMLADFEGLALTSQGPGKS